MQLKREKEVDLMDLGAQSEKSVDTNEAEKAKNYGNRDKLVKVRMNGREFYLLTEVDRKLGFFNMSTSVRWLVEHFEDLEKARQLVALFEKRKAAEKDIDAALGFFWNTKAFKE